MECSSDAVLLCAMENEEIVLEETSSAPDDLCRICATTNEYLITIFEGEGLENGLCAKINAFLPITVSRDDDLTHLICYQCASQILAWNDLHDCALRADKQLRVIHQSRNEVAAPADEPPTTNSSSEVHNKSASLNGNEETSNDDGRSEALQHKKTSQIADSHIESQNLENDHISQIGARVGIKEESVNLAKDPNKDHAYEGIEDDYEHKVCEQIPIKHLSEEKSSRMLKLNDGDQDATRNFLCAKCNNVYPKKSDLLSHLFNDHAESVQKPRIHNKLEREVIEKAKVYVDGRVYYHCSECGKNLHSPYTFSWHVRIHTGERPFICDLCGRQFRVSQGLVRHLKETHAGIKKFSCDICGRYFATKRNVAEHRRIHTGERPYVCDLCGKSFKQKASLFVHNRSHTDVYPFKCSFCSQSFRTRPTQQIHETKHTGVKPYSCLVCGRCFRIKYELKRHMLIHSAEKPFSCKICNISFRQKRYLRNHNKNNHISSSG